MNFRGWNTELIVIAANSSCSGFCLMYFLSFYLWLFFVLIVSGFFVSSVFFMAAFGVAFGITFGVALAGFQIIGGFLLLDFFEALAFECLALANLLLVN